MEAACVRPPQPVQPGTSKVKPMRLRPRIENPVNSSLVILPISFAKLHSILLPVLTWAMSLLLKVL